MLFGEHFRGCHESRLHRIFCRRIDERGGDRGFARADISLEQSVHLPAAHHVPHGLFYRSALCAGRGEGEMRKIFFTEISLYNRARVLLSLRAHFFKPEL